MLRHSRGRSWIVGVGVARRRHVPILIRRVHPHVVVRLLLLLLLRIGHVVAIHGVHLLLRVLRHVLLMVLHLL